MMLMKMKKVDTSISSVASVYNTDSKVAVQSVMKLSDLALMVSWNTTVRLLSKPLNSLK